MAEKGKFEYLRGTLPDQELLEELVTETPEQKFLRLLSAQHRYDEPERPQFPQENEIQGSLRRLLSHKEEILE